MESFEDLLKALENLVKTLESKDISLELSVAKYKEGKELVEKLNKLLKEASKVIVTEG